MKVYLAARYSRREELRAYAADLVARGYEVTSRWLHGHHQVDNEGLSEEADATDRNRFAQEDWDDMQSADVVISFTEAPRTSNSRGGRHVEFGGALALGKVCFVVGPRENVFHCLPQVIVFSSWKTFCEGEHNHEVPGQL